MYLDGSPDGGLRTDISPERQPESGMKAAQINRQAWSGDCSYFSAAGSTKDSAVESCAR